MKDSRKNELTMDMLENAAGGTVHNQNNSKNRGNQQNTLWGDNFFNNNLNSFGDIVQTNTITNNSGPVNVGSPMIINYN